MEHQNDLLQAAQELFDAVPARELRDHLRQWYDARQCQSEQVPADEHLNYRELERFLELAMRQSERPRKAA